MNDQSFKNCLHQNSIFIKFLKILKIHEIFVEIREFFVLFYNVRKENMFTIKMERPKILESNILVDIRLKNILRTSIKVQSEIQTLEKFGFD